jgi:hypothetical protein
VRAVADVYGPTATSDAMSAAASPGGERDRRKHGSGVQPVAAAGTASDLNGNASGGQARYVALDRADRGAGTLGQHAGGDVAGRAGAQFLDERVLALDERQRLMQLRHALDASGTDKPGRHE